MGKKIQIDDKEYDGDTLSETGKSHLSMLNYVSKRVQELNHHRALLLTARNSYVVTLKQEMVSNKAGFLLDED